MERTNKEALLIGGQKDKRNKPRREAQVTFPGRKVQEIKSFIMISNLKNFNDIFLFMKEKKSSVFLIHPKTKYSHFMRL